ncbi:group 3 secretory phospholipase A2-like [Enoplosus armatus]|uniref:group 3 secretory phospholipase A2-like n=1 Tax=Enoplosus armatus TaxID=215367 RepID=UPI003996C4C2
MTRIAPLVAVILTSSLLRWTEASILCSRTEVLPTGEVRYTFLRQASPSLRLYHSAWSGERTLLSCAWSDDAAVIQNYFSACRERAQEFSDQPDERVDVQSVFEAEGLCVSMEAPHGHVHTGKKHARSAESPTEETHQGQAERSEVTSSYHFLILPGTLWCGSGNNAQSYEDLGILAETDSCCREHDHCNFTLPPSGSDHGVFNNRGYTMSHCDCDNKFRSCLMEAGDRMSDVVGRTYFDRLKTHCFEFSHQLQCTQRNWFGMCKESTMVLHGEVHPPALYGYPNSTEVSMNSTIINPTEPTGKQLSCSVFKDLDECTDKILPQQQRHGLHNPEATTLYHCNCTARLFHTLANQRQLTKVQALLLGHVSQACFLPKACTAGKICKADLVKVELPQLDQGDDADVEVDGPNGMRADKRQDRAARLHKLCLRMVQNRR